MGPLSGRTIAFLEARRSDEMAHLVERQGGTPYVAPALREVPDTDSAAVASWLRALAADEFQLVLFLTGVGCRGLLEAAERAGWLDGVLAALARSWVVARGPKPVHVLKQYGVRIDFVPPEPNTSDELLAELATRSLAGTVVGVQLYGGRTPFLDRLLTGIEHRGARVVTVMPYRWERPLDEQPLRDLIDACLGGRIDAVAILSSSQIHNLFAVAEECDEVVALTAALNSERLLVAAVGPVAAEAIASHGVRVSLQPEHPKMGHLVRSLADALGPRGERAPQEAQNAG